MNYRTFTKGDSARLGDQIVTIAIVYDSDAGPNRYLIEHSDGSFSRVSGSVLMPIGAEQVKRESKLPSIAATAGRFFRQPSKRKVMFR